MGKPKLSLELAPGKKLGSFALEQLLACRQLNVVVVVVRPDDPLDWLPERRDEGTIPRIHLIKCNDSFRGMSRSIRCGLRSTVPDNPDAVLMALADQPFVMVDLFDRMVSVYSADRTLDFVACADRGEARPPVLFAPAMFAALSMLRGDTGARKLLVSPRFRGAKVDVPFSYPFMDVDLPEDLEEAKQMWGLIAGNKDI